MVKRSREDFDIPSSREITGSPESASSFSPPKSSPAVDIHAEEGSKLFHIDTESGEAVIPIEVMRCSLPPHARQTISFASFEDYEVHYNKIHVNRCVECRKNFPTPHFLELHISENHNPLVDVLKDRGEHTYACFVEDCDRKCSTPQKRRMHLIDKHVFPKDYDFYVVNEGIDQRSSMLRSGRHRRRSSAAQHKTEIDDRARRRTSTLTKTTKQDPMEGSSSNVGKENRALNAGEAATADTSQPDTEMDGLAGAMSALKFVPTSIKFGRGRGRGGFSKT